MVSMDDPVIRTMIRRTELELKLEEVGREIDRLSQIKKQLGVEYEQASHEERSAREQFKARMKSERSGAADTGTPRTANATRMGIRSESSPPGFPGFGDNGV